MRTSIQGRSKHAADRLGWQAGSLARASCGKEEDRCLPPPSFGGDEAADIRLDVSPVVCNAEDLRISVDRDPIRGPTFMGMCWFR